jgi:cytosine/uracil/thiamine/allantoin permease
MFLRKPKLVINNSLQDSGRNTASSCCATYGSGVSAGIELSRLAPTVSDYKKIVLFSYAVSGSTLIPGPIVELTQKFLR